MWGFGQDDHTLEITTIFALLDAHSFVMPMLQCLSLVYHVSHIAMSASNLFTLPSKPLFGHVTRFCSAPLIALLVVGEDEVGSMLEHVYVGISQYLLS